MKGLKILVGFALWCALAQGQDTFERVFHTPRQLDAATVARVSAGEKLTLDSNGDGKVDEMWYLDTSPRHTTKPLLVRVLDEDGDMARDNRGDLDSDLYFYDWNADASIDVVIDYQDDDGDNDVDAMGMFFNTDLKDGKEHLTVWWGVDIGDDNLLWYDVNGTYDQPACQYRTHFSGDEMFYQFRLDDDAPAWINVWEDPFAFYDFDRDQCSEEVVRISAKGNEVQNLRYSMDADNDAYGRRTHDYDFSVTAIPSDKGLSPAPADTKALTIRSIPTLPVLTWEKTRGFSQNAPWGKAMLTWDEVNSNTDGDAAHDPNERWEGILNAPSKTGSFPQVGGPATSKWNKRVEVATSPPAPLRLYFDVADRRLHLFGATEGYWDIDYNFDGKVDAAYRYLDENGDGVFDRRTFDADGDGVDDCSWPMAGRGQEFPLEFDAIHPFYTRAIQEDLDGSQRFLDSATLVLESLPPNVQAVRDYFSNQLSGYLPEREVGAHIQKTEAGQRFYLDLIRDMVFAKLTEKIGKENRWKAVEDAYGRGAYAEASSALLVNALTDQGSIELNPDREFTKRIAVEVAHDGDAPYPDAPVVLSVETLREKAGDFNPDCCAVTQAQAWVDWVELPHQTDTFGWDDAQELSFLADLTPHSRQTFYIHYTPQGQRPLKFPALTRAVLDTPAYVAWESDYGAYRFYTGQFDFFGKHVDRLLPRTDRLLYPIVGQDYHTEQPWGMDALHVNKTSGLGGLTWYGSGGECPVQSPAGVGHVTFAHRVLGAGPVRAAVEIRAKNVIPDKPDAEVVFRCFSYAGHQESEIRVRMPKEAGEGLLAPGLLDLGPETMFFDQSSGVLGQWGWQEEGIGDIGLAVIVPPARISRMERVPGETRVLCALENQELRYWIAGDWRRGRQYPIAPTAANWQWELKRLANDLHHAPSVTIQESSPNAGIQRHFAGFMQR